MLKSEELVFIRMPFEEDIMGRLSVTTEFSAGKQIKQPNFHPVLISTVKYLESPGKESRVRLTGFIVRSFPHRKRCQNIRRFIIEFQPIQETTQ